MENGFDGILAAFVTKFPNATLGRHRACVKSQKLRRARLFKRESAQATEAPCRPIRQRPRLSDSSASAVLPATCCIHDVKRVDQPLQRTTSLSKILTAGAARGLARDLIALSWLGSHVISARAFQSLASFGLEIRTPPADVTEDAIDNSVTDADVSSMLAREIKYHSTCRKRVARLASSAVLAMGATPGNGRHATEEEAMAQEATAIALQLLAKGQPAAWLNVLIPGAERHQLRAVASILRENCEVGVAEKGSQFILVPYSKPWTTVLEAFEVLQGEVTRRREAERTGPQRCMHLHARPSPRQYRAA